MIHQIHTGIIFGARQKNIKVQVIGMFSIKFVSMTIFFFNSLILDTLTEEEVKERSKRAAAAARRWREYSRNGADRPPTFNLPETISNKD